MSRGENIFTRFWNKVDKSGDCWNWLGAIDGFGYGSFCLKTVNYKTKHSRAHRFSYEIHFGEIPKGMLVCHTCDNPPCVNPSHLFLGTDADNNKDRAFKGRSATGINHGTKTCPDSVPRGEKHRLSKFTNNEIKEVRNMYESGKFYQREIAKMFSVSRTCIQKIVSLVRHNV